MQLASSVHTRSAGPVENLWTNYSEGGSSAGQVMIKPPVGASISCPGENPPVLPGSILTAPVSALDMLACTTASRLSGC